MANINGAGYALRYMVDTSETITSFSLSGRPVENIPSSKSRRRGSATDISGGILVLPKVGLPRAAADSLEKWGYLRIQVLTVT